MSEVSRRDSLKTLGAAGAAIALGGVAAAQQAEPKQDKPASSTVDVALDRFAKGHS